MIAAGSLLEFALTQLESFGVGRIENLFMHPISFHEFLLAQNKTGILDAITNASYANTMSQVLHERLRETFKSSCMQAGKKFIYKHAYLDASSQSVHDTLSLLAMAGIFTKVHHSNANGIPFCAETNLKKLKTLPIDTGIYNRFNGLRIQDMVVLRPEEFINMGALVEAAIGLELLANALPTFRPELFYWHREAKSSIAEFDYVIESNNEIIPLEVKVSKKRFNAPRKSSCNYLI